MSAGNRSTNGHRFVFHSSEIAASERHYIAGEPGVIPYHPPPPPLCPAVRMMPSSTYPLSTSINGSPIRLPHGGEYYYNQSGQHPEHLATSPINMGERNSDEWSVRTSSPPMPPFSPVRSPVPERNLSPLHIPQPPLPRSPSPVIKLKGGDMLYWHHLSRHGEIPGVQEDPRARRKGSRWRPSQGTVHKDDGLDDDTSVGVTGMAVVCGR